MKLIATLLLLTMSLYAETILVMNSNAKIDRYKSMEKAFSQDIKSDFKRIDIGNMAKDEIREYLYDIYPDRVYAIGNKAFQYASKYIPEKKIFFSSIVNYKRLKMGKKCFGVSNELHTGMKLTLIKSLLSHTKTISMIYSRYTKNVYESFKEEAKHVGIKVIGQKIDKDDTFDMQKLQSADAFVMIADPILLKDEKKVKELYSTLKKRKKAIVAYHPLYIKYGAVLILSVDTPTVGRQVASMIKSDMSGNTFVNIQTPIGSKVIFNEGLAKRIKLYYNKSALGIVNKVIK
ncbi:MAG: ABC transporter substrate-binding protein [Epsilonproteobacteria bacterium]|nr:MAG: ABC transporter substrate-binding protein [Campylobacterota bacterium]